MFTKCINAPGVEAQALHNLGNLATLQEDQEKALFYYKKSMEVK
jgi:hypothetical protein